LKVLRTVQEVREWRQRGRSLALVPTMGALHEGHAALILHAVTLADDAMATIFVNPTQFGPNEDLSRYPRQEEADLEVCRACGAAAVFAPSAEEMYPASTTAVVPAGPALGWDGDLRPGHFQGVATVVLKLFMISEATHAVFGLKDLQQCAVIRKMVNDLNVPIELAFCETVREASGLALSSRNAYLSPQHRQEAALIHKELQRAAQAICGGASPTTACEFAVSQLAEAGFIAEYVAMVDASTMLIQEELTDESRLIAAAKWHGVRLIDNISVLR
jgi:pantoate--beta-alanine ligase